MRDPTLASLFEAIARLPALPASVEREQISMSRQPHLTEQAFSRRIVLKAAAIGSAAFAATRSAFVRAQSDQQVLHVAFEGGIKNYAPGQDTDPYILPFVFMTPLLVDSNNQVSPWLATAVTPNADNT